MSDQPATGLARGIAAALLVGSARILGSMPCARPREAEDDARLVRLRQTVWRLRRAYEDATDGQGGDVLVELVAQLSSVFRSTVHGVPLWIDQIETLAQDAEQRFGSGPGLGPYKLEQVKAALAYLMSRTTNTAVVALQLDPAPMSAVIDLTIDFVVALLNRQGLWVSEEPIRSKASWSSRLWRWIAWRALTAFGRMRAWLAPPATLSPAMRASVDRILADPGGDPFVLVTDVMKLIAFVSDHRREVASIAEIVSTACSEAEGFVGLSGAEKQLYARDLILVLFEEEYGIELTGAARGIFEFVADRLTDGVVRIFNKRGVFSHLGPVTR